MNKINLTAILIIIVCSLFMRWDYWASVNEENSSKNFAIGCHSDSIMRIEIIKSLIIMIKSQFSLRVIKTIGSLMVNIRKVC